MPIRLSLGEHDLCAVSLSNTSSGPQGRLMGSLGYILAVLGRGTGPRGEKMAGGFTGTDSRDLATILDPFRTIFAVRAEHLFMFGEQCSGPALILLQSMETDKNAHAHVLVRPDHVRPCKDSRKTAWRKESHADTFITRRARSLCSLSLKYQ